MKGLGEAGTWIIFALVVAAALSTFLPLQGPQMPGTLRLAVLEGPGTARTLSGVNSFCSYLSEEIRRTVKPVVVRAPELQDGFGGAHVVLVPAELMPSGWEVLAWVKGEGMGAAHDRPYVVYPKSQDWAELPAPRLILGDRWTWAGGQGAVAYLQKRGHPLEGGFSRVEAGVDIYDHTPVLAALVYGAFDVAVVRESDLRRAVRAGWVDPERFVFGPAGPAGNGLVLAASTALGSGARGKVRTAALNLSTFGFDRKHLPAAAALNGLAILGIEGFVPDRIFPSLLPPSGSR